MFRDRLRAGTYNRTINALKGQPAATFTLSFLGGTVGAESLSVPGMPEFTSGDEEFVFATAGESICPLVGAMHGRYRVLHDPVDAHAYVARDNLAPLTSTDQVGAPMEGGAVTLNTSAALTPEAFEQRIASEVAHPTNPAPR